MPEALEWWGGDLCRRCVRSGHEVVALSRSTEKVNELEARGAKVAVADALDKDGLIEAIKREEPEVIIHQLTALTSFGNFKKFDEEFALTNRLRTEVTDTLLAAARLDRSATFHRAKLLRMALCP